MKKKTAILVLIIALLALGVICYKPIQWNVSKKVKVNLVGDFEDNTILKTDLLIDGRYTFKLFRPDTFVGTLELPILSETKGRNVELELEYNKPHDLIYHHYNGSKLVSDFVGYIYANVGMKHIIIIKEETTNQTSVGDDNITIFYTDDIAWEDVKLLIGKDDNAT